MDESESAAGKPHGREPVTFAVVLALTTSVVAGAADGALAKLLAVPLALIVAWAVLLASRRGGRRLDVWGDDRLLALVVLGGALLGGAVVVASLSPKEPSATLVILGPSAVPLRRQAENRPGGTIPERSVGMRPPAVGPTSAHETSASPA